MGKGSDQISLEYEIVTRRASPMPIPIPEKTQLHQRRLEAQCHVFVGGLSSVGGSPTSPKTFERRIPRRMTLTSLPRSEGSERLHLMSARCVRARFPFTCPMRMCSHKELRRVASGEGECVRFGRQIRADPGSRLSPTLVAPTGWRPSRARETLREPSRQDYVHI